VRLSEREHCRRQLFTEKICLGALDNNHATVVFYFDGALLLAYKTLIYVVARFVKLRAIFVYYNFGGYIDEKV